MLFDAFFCKPEKVLHFYQILSQFEQRVARFLSNIGGWCCLTPFLLQTRKSVALLSNFVTIWAKSWDVSVTILIILTILMLFDALFLQTRESFALLSNFVTIWAKSCEVSATQLCGQIRQGYMFHIDVVWHSFLQTRKSVALLSNFVIIWAKSCEVSATQLCEQIRQRYKDRYSKTFLGKDNTKQKKQN